MKLAMTALALAATAALAAPPALAATDTRFQAVGVGALEVPPNTSPGSAVTIIDIAGTNVAVNTQFRDLVADASAAHIHCCTGSAFTGTAPIAVPFTDFPTGVTMGTYNKTLDMSVDTAFDAGFLGANGGTASSAFSALQAGIAANEAYVNIHTAQYPQGEIRGWLVAAPIPEPATWAMLGIGLAGLGFMARRRVG